MQHNTQNHGQRTNWRRLRAVAARSRWLVPLTALAAIALSVVQLDAGPVRWAKPVEDTLGRVAGITGETTVCIFLAVTVLVYWTLRERQEAAADLAIALAWLTGIPGMPVVAGWIVRGATIMFATLRRKVYEQIRNEGREEGLAEGHVEGHAEGQVSGRRDANAAWQAWWWRRTQTGTFVEDPNDPPPDLSD